VAQYVASREDLDGGRVDVDPQSELSVDELCCEPILDGEVGAEVHQPHLVRSRVSSSRTVSYPTRVPSPPSCRRMRPNSVDEPAAKVASRRCGSAPQGI
jgi:hypothetical protein